MAVPKADSSARTPSPAPSASRTPPSKQGANKTGTASAKKAGSDAKAKSKAGNNSSKAEWNDAKAEAYAAQRANSKKTANGSSANAKHKAAGGVKPKPEKAQAPAPAPAKTATAGTSGPGGKAAAKAAPAPAGQGKPASKPVQNHADVERLVALADGSKGKAPPPAPSANETRMLAKADSMADGAKARVLGSPPARAGSPPGAPALKHPFRHELGRTPAYGPSFPVYAARSPAPAAPNVGPSQAAPSRPSGANEARMRAKADGMGGGLPARFRDSAQVGTPAIPLSAHEKRMLAKADGMDGGLPARFRNSAAERSIPVGGPAATPRAGVTGAGGTPVYGPPVPSHMTRPAAVVTSTATPAPASSATGAPAASPQPCPPAAPASGGFWDRLGLGVASAVWNGGVRQAATDIKEFGGHPQAVVQKWVPEGIGGLGSAAWDMGQGFAWIAGQAGATAAEIANQNVKANTGKQVLETGAAWSAVHRTVSSYGDSWKKEMQTFGANTLGMRTGQGGTEKSMAFSTGEVLGFVGSFFVPVSKVGSASRVTSAAGAGAATRTGAAAFGLADDAARAAPPLERAVGGVVDDVGRFANEAAATTSQTAAGQSLAGRIAAVGQNAWGKVANWGGSVKSGFDDWLIGKYNRLKESNDELAEKLTEAKAQIERGRRATPPESPAGAAAKAADTTVAQVAETSQPGLLRRILNYPKQISQEVADVFAYPRHVYRTVGGIVDEFTRAVKLKADQASYPALAAINRTVDNFVVGTRAAGARAVGAAKNWGADAVRRFQNTIRRVPGADHVASAYQKTDGWISQRTASLVSTARRTTAQIADGTRIGVDAVTRSRPVQFASRIGEGVAQSRPAKLARRMGAAAEPWAAKSSVVVYDLGLSVVNGGVKAFKVIGKPFKALEWVSRQVAKYSTGYLAVEAYRGNVEWRSDTDVLTKANISTDPEHSLGAWVRTIGTTEDALIPASVSMFISLPSAKGFNPAALWRGEWDKVLEPDKAVPSTFARPGKDGKPQVASNRSGRANLGAVGFAYSFGPYFANFNGNANVAFATLNASLRGEAGDIVKGTGFDLGGRFYAALGLLWRFSSEMNFDYPALNIPGGFFDGRVVMQALRKRMGDHYYLSGGFDPFFDGQLTQSFAPLGRAGVKKTGRAGELVGTYLGTSIVNSGGALRGGFTGWKDDSSYPLTFSRNPKALETALNFQRDYPDLYSRPFPFLDRPLFKQVEQIDPKAPRPDSGGGGARWADCLPNDTFRDEPAPAGEAPRPTAPRPPQRPPVGDEERLERKLREAERRNPTQPPSRLIAHEPPPIASPGVWEQFAVSPHEGLKVRAAPGTQAGEVAKFRHGEFVVQTGPAQLDADGQRWVPVVGRRAGSREEVQGFVREDLIAAHPQGDADAEGRIDSDLRRQGYTAVSVRAGDTVRDIARRNGLADHEIRDVVVLNSRHQLVDPDLIYPGDAVYLPPRP